MTREEAIQVLKEISATLKSWSGFTEYPQAIDMAIEALSADATVAKIQIDDIDKAKTSSQLLDDLAVDMVKAMGKRIVEVVRCKDCRHHGMNDCPMWDGAITEDYMWCYFGERREK